MDAGCRSYSAATQCAARVFESLSADFFPRSSPPRLTATHDLRRPQIIVREPVVRLLHIVGIAPGLGPKIMERERFLLVPAVIRCFGVFRYRYFQSLWHTMPMPFTYRR
jgi:hypothetical protein